MSVARAITAFRTDSAGHWLAQLSCGHTQHVRHDPPWQLRPWTQTETGRDSMIGTSLSCKHCEEDQALPRSPERESSI